MGLLFLEISHRVIKCDVQKERGNTFCKLVNSKLVEIDLLRMRAESILCVPKEVFPNLSLTKLSKVCLVSVNATA